MEIERRGGNGDSKACESLLELAAGDHILTYRLWSIGVFNEEVEYCLKPESYISEEPKHNAEIEDVTEDELISILNFTGG